MNSFIKEFLVLIKNNISDNNASIYNSNKNLEKYNLYKNVMLTGRYNEKLSQRYALQTFDKLVECDFCYIDKSILDYNTILDNQSRIKLDYDSILDTLRSVYSEFFI